MEPIFQFIGGFWWLIFPLFGVLASLGSAWERGARRRHRRRLEVLHAKAELKAAQAAARGRIAYPVTGSVAQQLPDAQPAPTAHGHASAAASQLERLFAAHDAVTARWLEYELDVSKLIAFPAMSDGRQPLTAAFLRAKKVADGLRPPTAKTRLTKAQFTEYRDAVTDYEVAFDVAERDARRIKDSGFTDVERKRLDTAKQLLTVAIDQAATPAERQLAYKRVREELDGLISLSDEAIVVLEKQVGHELTAGPSAASSSARTTDAASPPAEPVPVRSPAVGSAGAGSAAGAAPATPPAPQPTAAPGAGGAEASGAPQPMRAPAPGASRPGQTWPVPSRTTDTAPGRIVRPKPRP
ncbi:hypothetical protein G5T42_04930 [Microbacterium sp. 4R-513]|uniref:hypothetical protein n=1 Tax=Microbacterium sp. 4R-513 TaxID=2567934 RepID=UPI0013E14298|nr:hypothetical protein [Microbacterium sp. 4R-513]QIG38909.1 hypothetical protein G5T42_04930 [Microbacterium sp. 4R-513]